MLNIKKSNFYLGLITAIAALALSGCAQQTADPVASSVSSTSDASANSSSCGEENLVVDFGFGDDYIANAEVIPGANLRVQLLKDQNTGVLLFGDLFIQGEGGKETRVRAGTIIYQGQSLSGQKYRIGSELVGDDMHVHVQDQESGQKVADLAKLTGISASELLDRPAESSLDGCIVVYNTKEKGPISGGLGYLTLKELSVTETPEPYPEDEPASSENQEIE